jgi:two-component system, chemotaxis family, sensor kinase CheA
MASEAVINEFLAETREHLSNTERDLLAIENGHEGNDPDLVNRLFRSIHSIKGASGTFGFHGVMVLSHAMESVLLLFRDGKMTPDGDKINALLDGVDKLRCMINDIHASNEMDHQCEVQRLEGLLKGEGEVPNPPCGTRRRVEKPETRAADPVSPAEPNNGEIMLEITDPVSSGVMVFQVYRAEIASAVSRCHHVCALRVHHNRDLEEKQRTYQEFLANLEAYGRCLDLNSHQPSCSTADLGPPSDQPSHVLFATILEPDLMGAALDIPDDQIHVIDPGVLQELLQTDTAPPSLKHVPQSAMEPGCPQRNDTTSHHAPETVRVNVERLDTLINLAGELVLGRNQLRQMLEASVDENPRLRTIIQNVNLVTSEMQEHILRMRMQPVDNILNRIRRIIRDLARQLGKEAELVIEGGDVELDKSILEGLMDPLIHIVRNCIDHGIESPDERVARGKPSRGEIQLRAFHEAGQVNISIADDGRGMDIDRIVEKAVARGILNIEDARMMNEKDKLNLVFLPGFSTTNTVTDVSGRGVGMDIVKHNIERFGGHIEIDSLAGSGTTIRITIPLTLAIIPSLIVGAANQQFAVPQVNVRELVCVRAEDTDRRVEQIGEAPVLRLRERLLPLVRLADTVGLARTFVHPAGAEEMIDRRTAIADRRQSGRDRAVYQGDRRQSAHARRLALQRDIFVVVLRVGGNLFGLIVDELFDIEEIVVKPLSDHIKDCQCFVGATIMGDGRVAMILDAAGIASLAKLRFAEVNAEQLRRHKEEQTRQKALTAERQSIIVFNNALQEHFALPLSSISRLEKIIPEAVERIGNHEFITYSGKALPLIRLETLLPVRPSPASPKELYVIIPKAGGCSVGIVASRIVDTFEVAPVVEKGAGMPRGFLGSTVLAGQITVFLDVEEILKIFRNGFSVGEVESGGWKHREHEAVCHL